MARTALFDGSGRRVGSTETRSNGNVAAYDSNGTPLHYRLLQLDQIAFRIRQPVVLRLRAEDDSKKTCRCV